MGDGDGTAFYNNSLNDAEVIETVVRITKIYPRLCKREVKTLTGIEPTGYFNSKLTSTFKRWYFSGFIRR